MEIALDDAGAPPKWLKVLPIGTFSGRDGRGPYSIPDKAAAEEIVRVTLARAASAELPVDYDHQSDFAAQPGVGGRAPASGWFKAYEVRDDGIYAQVEWTPAAQAALAAKEYRYLSPVFHHDKGGPRVRLLLRAGLTNNPNLDLPAVAAQQLQGHDMDKAQLAQALGLPADATEEQIMAAIAANAASAAAINQVAAAAGLQTGAEATAICTAVATAVANAARPDPAKFVPIEQVTALQAQVVELQNGSTKDKAETAVNKAIEEGRLAPALRDWALSLHASDAAKFEQFVANAPVVLKPGQQLAGKQPEAAATLTDVERAVCAATGVSEEEFLKTKKEEA